VTKQEKYDQGQLQQSMAFQVTDLNSHMVAAGVPEGAAEILTSLREPPGEGGSQYPVFGSESAESQLHSYPSPDASDHDGCESRDITLHKA